MDELSPPISSQDYQVLKKLADRWLQQYRALSPYIHPNEFLDAVIPYCLKLPVTIHDCLFQMQKERRKVLLLKGFPNDEILPRTPMVEDAAIVKPSYMAEFWISVIGSCLGDIYGYYQEGKLFQNLYPTKKAEKIYSGHSSKKPLSMHVDNTHIASAKSGAHTPDYILLYASKDDPHRSALTPHIELSEVLAHITSREKKILFEKKFRPQMLHAFGGKKGDILNKPISILYGELNDPCVQFNPLLKGITQEAIDTMYTFQKIANRLQHQLHLEPGSLLIINNKKVLHARSEFQVNFDGNDRWLVRSYVSRNLGSVADDLCEGGRIIKPKF